MEQVDGGDLIVNKGNESRPKDGTVEGRELNAVEGYDAAVKTRTGTVSTITDTNELLMTCIGKP